MNCKDTLNAKIADFVKRAIDNNSKEYIKLGHVDEQIARRIKQEIDFDISKFDFVLSSNSVRHIKNRHFNEKQKNQQRVTKEDFIKIDDIVNKADSFESGEYKYLGKTLPAIKFMKNIDGDIHLVMALFDRDKQLSVVTMYHKIDNALLHNGKKDISLKSSDTIKDSPADTSSSKADNTISKEPYNGMKKGFVNTGLFDGFSKKYEAIIDTIVDDLVMQNLSKLEKKIFKTLGFSTNTDMFIASKKTKQTQALMDDLRADYNNIDSKTQEIKASLDRIGGVDAKLITQVLNGDVGFDKLPKSARGLYQTLRKALDNNANKLVELGVLDEKYKIEHYVKRYYEAHLQKKSSFAKFFSQSSLKKRKLHSYEERLAKGMIEDLGFVVSNSIKEQERMISKAMFLKNLADKYASDVELDGYVAVGNKMIDDVKQWGALNGKYVPIELARSLEEARVVHKEVSLWHEIVNHIKVNLTVKNVPTHVYNFLSNINLAFLYGDVLHTASMMGKPKMFKSWVKRAEAVGMSKGFDEFEQVSTVKNGDGDNSIVMTLLKNVYMAEGSFTGNAMRSAYAYEDNLFKISRMKKLVEEYGLSDKEAWARANDEYVNHQSATPFLLEKLDKSGLSPFVRYVYRSTPVVAKAILKHPFKFVAMNMAFMLGGASLIDEHSKDEDVLKPFWAKSGGNFLGLKEYFSIGDGLYFNAGRLVPAFRYNGISSSVLDFFGDEGDGKINAGFIGSGINIWINHKNALGYNLQDLDNRAFEKILASAEGFLPPITLGRYAQRLGHIELNRLGLVEKPRLNYYGEPMDEKELILRAFGVREFNEISEVVKGEKRLLAKERKALRAKDFALADSIAGEIEEFRNAYARVRTKFARAGRKLRGGSLRRQNDRGGSPVVFTPFVKKFSFNSL